MTALMMGATHEIAAAYGRIHVGTLYAWKAIGKKIYDRVQAEYKREIDEKTAVWWAKRGGEDLPDTAKPDFSMSPDEKRFYEFYEAIIEAEAAGGVVHLQHLSNHARTDPKASMWLLENRYGYGRTQKVEVTGKDGGAIETKDVTDLTPEERAIKVLALVSMAQKRAESMADDGATD